MLRPMEDQVGRLNQLFGKSGFDLALRGMELLSAGGGRAEVRLPVGESVSNPVGVLHGGAIATLVDDVGTLAIITADRHGRPGVTTDLGVSYLAPAPAGASVLAQAAVLKIGRTLAFVSVDVRRESDGVLVAQGRMTKHLG
jgi:acyl-coenzyme A thioesterase 13